MGPVYPWWGPMCGFSFIMLVIMLAVLCMALCLFFGRRGFCSPWLGPTRPDNRGYPPESPLEILQKRYARGEISKEELELMQKDILS